MLAVLLLFFLLFAVGTLVAYRLSSASKVRKRMQEALSPLEELDTESRRLRQSVQNEIELSSSQYIQEVHSARLKAIPLDELKTHATGLRLQALKDVGIWSIAGLQRWNEYRISQVRGVGPKSASAIVRAVAIITASAKAVPINHPAPPFSGDTERQLMEALYRQHWFDTHITEQADAFRKTLALDQSIRDELATKIGFGHWLWKFGSNETIRDNIDRADAMIRVLQEESSQFLQDKLSTSLGECHTVCANRIPVESIIQDFNENRDLYDSWLTRQLGQGRSKSPAKPMLQQTAPNNSVVSDLVHVEFGRVVPGPPPQPTGGNRTVPASPETNPPHPEGLVSVKIGSSIAEQATEFALPMAQRAARLTNLRWLAKDEPVQIQGHTLPRGFVYVGKGVNAGSICRGNRILLQLCSIQPRASLALPRLAR